MAETLTITPLAALADNYVWLVEHQNRAVCIDPGEAAPVVAYLQERGLALEQIWITHHHHDHTGGIAGLKQAYPQCAVYGNGDIPQAGITVGEGFEFEFAGCRVNVWATPGHTGTHVGYLLRHGGGLHVFCGDTLFSGGCGRVFTGTAAQLFASLQRYAQLPESALFYPAHEYTAANLRFAVHIEPDNTAVAAALAAARQTPTLPVTLAHELAVNPFLRTDKPQVRAAAQAWSGRSLADAAEVFAVLREWKNGF